MLIFHDHSLVRYQDIYSGAKFGQGPVRKIRLAPESLRFCRYSDYNFQDVGKILPYRQQNNPEAAGRLAMLTTVNNNLLSRIKTKAEK